MNENDDEQLRAPSGRQYVNALSAAGVDNVVTVPDWVQIPLHQELRCDKSRRIALHSCCTEDEAFMIAAGLHIGGKRPAVVIQNQGFYAGLNGFRGVAMDAELPLVVFIGQFGREHDDFSRHTRESGRRVVHMLEPLLDLLGVPFWKVDSARQLDVVEQAYTQAWTDRWPAAVILDRDIRWD